MSGPFGAAVTLSILIDAFKPRLGATAASLDAALQIVLFVTRSVKIVEHE